MDRSSLVWVLVLLVAAGGLVGPQLSSAPNQSNKPVGLAAEAGHGTSFEDKTADKLLSRFLKIDKPVDSSAGVTASPLGLSLPGLLLRKQSSTDPTFGELTELVNRARQHHFKVKFLIATVTDPIDSHTGWEFDQMLDAIRRGFERQSFILDRFYFPWAEAIRNSQNEASQAARKEFRDHPGLLLFRSVQKSEPHDLYVVFLVGETATTGIQKTAFAQALSFVERYEWVERVDLWSSLLWNWQSYRMPLAAIERPLRVKVLGPMYSGSSWSIKHAIQEWAHADGHPFPQVAFEIVSGSAQVRSNVDWLRFDQEQNAEWRIRVTATFHATVLPSIFISSQLVDHLFAKSSEIVLLCEDSTVYGQQVSDNGKNDPSNVRFGRRITRIQFPLLIGRLRSAYEKSRIGKESNAANASRSSGNKLQLSLDENAAAIDIPPALSSLTAPIIEQTVQNILAAIADRNPRYVGILGGDSLDVLFLCQLVRTHCPNVHIFTHDADLLYTHADYRRWCEGMLVASPYPLFMRSQAWTQNSTQEVRSGRTQFDRAQFQSYWAQGIFNATQVFLSSVPLRRTAGMIDYAEPFCKESRAPPLWLVTVGNGAYWPVNHFSSTSEAPLEKSPSNGHRGAEQTTEPYTLQADQPAQPVPLNAADCELTFGQSGWLRMVTFVFSCFCLVNAVQFVTGGAGAWTWFSVRRRPGCRRFLLEQYLYQFTYFAALLLILGILLSPLLIGLRFDFWEDLGNAPELGMGFARQMGFVVEFIAAAAMAPICVVLLWHFILALLDVGRRRAGRFHRLRSLALPALLCACQVLAGLLLLTWLVVVAGPPQSAWDNALTWASWCVLACGATAVLLTIQPERDRQNRIGSQLCLAGLIMFFALLAPLSVALNASAWYKELTDPSKLSKALDLAIFAERAGHITNGVSPLVPAALLIGLIWWRSISHLKRLDLLTGAEPPFPFPRTIGWGDLSAPGVDRLDEAGIQNDVKALNRALRQPLRSWFGSNWWTALFLTASAYLVLFEELYPTFENRWFRWFIHAALLSAFFAVCVALFHSLKIWHCCSQLLRRLAWHPMQGAYSRLPGKLQRIMSAQLMSPEPVLPELEVALHYWSQLAASSDDVNALRLKLTTPQLVAFAQVTTGAPQAARAYAWQIDRETKPPVHRQGSGRWSRCCQWSKALFNPSHFKTTAEAAAEAAAEATTEAAAAEIAVLAQIDVAKRAQGAALALFPLLAQLWWVTTPDRLSKKERDWLHTAEDFIAIQVAMYVRYVLVHLRNLLRTAVAIVMLALAAINSYPFQPQQRLLSFSWLLSSLVAVTAVYVFVQINRDDCISNMSQESKPGKITWDRNFVLALLGYGAVPLLTVLAMQFPEWRDYFSSTNDLLRTFKH